MVTALALAAVWVGAGSRSVPGSPCDLCSFADSRVEQIVEAAWQEAQPAQTKDDGEGKGAAKGKSDPFATVTDARQRADLERDYRIGKQYSELVEKELKLTDKPELTERLNRIGAEIAEIAQQRRVDASWGDKRLNPFPYTFKIVKGEEVNAFSLPGGFVYFYEGLLKYVESDHELAGVVAHEISHASFRHVATMERERSKMQAITLPLILISIFAGGKSGGDVAQGTQLFEQAIGSGWSQKAETAADWGAVQYLQGTKYNPVGILSFMERLARDERLGPNFFQGILRTHPPSRERALALTARLEQLGIPIRRSEVTTSLRTLIEPIKDGGYSVSFNGAKIVELDGPDAESRAREAAVKLNEFFDRVPALFDVRATGGNTISGFRRPLLVLQQSDADRAATSVAELTDRAVHQIKRGVYSIAYRVWDF
ncbi:MAG: M48 family metalloprotease [Fimbriimonadaceae bacterium]|nr:M48 family metalloprotease [Fimbriimonadaceae bacterium]